MTRGRRSGRLIATARAAAMLAALVPAALVLATPARADRCEVSQDPSPPSQSEARIVFRNESQFALRLYWSDFDGFLTPMGAWVQPGENRWFTTYAGHAWFVEMNTPEGRFCRGPVSATSRRTCNVRVLYDDGMDLDARGCDG